MSTLREVLLAMADVLSAGAKTSRQWPLNVIRTQDAEVLEAMAQRARELAEVGMTVQSRAAWWEAADNIGIIETRFDSGRVVTQSYDDPAEWRAAAREAGIDIEEGTQ